MDKNYGFHNINDSESSLKEEWNFWSHLRKAGINSLIVFSLDWNGDELIRRT